MRILLAAALCFGPACGKANDAGGGTAAAPPNPDCGAAVAHARTLATMPTSDSPAVVEYMEKAVEVGTRVMTERCQQDAWPTAMTDCLKSAIQQSDMSACNDKHLTPTQRAAMKKHSQAEMAKLPPPKQER